MKETKLLLLLLFLWSNVDCTLSNEGDPLLSDIFTQTTPSPGFENVPETSSDLHALVKDLSVKLSVLQTKMETLNKLQLKVKQLRRKNQDQAVELQTLKSRTNVTENQVDSLRRDRAGGRVAFSASLRHSGSGLFGPYDNHTTLVFRRVISNIGNAYNRHTGVFTAPVRGAYHFEFHFYVLSRKDGTWASLMKNEECIVSAQEEQRGGFGSAGNAATLLLEAGDLVFVQLFKSYGMYDNMYHHCTFSGRLLFTCDSAAQCL